MKRMDSFARPRVVTEVQRGPAAVDRVLGARFAAVAVRWPASGDRPVRSAGRPRSVSVLDIDDRAEGLAAGETFDVVLDVVGE